MREVEKISLEEELANGLSKQEAERTVYWNKYDPFVDLRMKWRASLARHLFHILPGQTILEVGAGNGKFTVALIGATKDECKITSAVFSGEYKNEIEKKIKSKNIDIFCLDSFPGSLRKEKFDYIIINHLLVNEFRNFFLNSLKSLLKPGGGLLLFEANPWNPYLRMRRIIKRILPFISQRQPEPILLNRLLMFSILSEIGYTQINALPYDFLYSPIPRFLLWPAKNLSIIMENFPYLRNFAGALYIWARNPPQDGQEEYSVDLCEHKVLYAKVSFVIPCHNEEMNIHFLVKRINDFYKKYIFEIIIIDDNSTDNTAKIVEGLTREYRNLHLIRRPPPAGLGRALRDGLKEAEGEYIVIMDSDFQHIVPEMRDLFDAAIEGADVVIGSRFSRESVLINYAFTKIIANRAFHILANLLLGKRFRDISNNLKILRREVAKKIVIESGDFAANAETGLKPILLGYRVVEVPISWFNRSIYMGFSTFRIFKTGPNYLKVLLRLFYRRLTGRLCSEF